MKYMLIIASVVALAVASPAHRGLIQPGVPGPAPLPEYEPIAGGPAVIDHVPIVAEPAPVFPVEDITVPVIPAPAPAPVPAPAPLVQIVLNINAGQVSAPVVPTLPIGEAPTVPVQVAPEPIDISLPVIVPEPAEIGTPELPTPEFIPESVDIGTPVLPLPAAVLPIDLN